MASASNSNIYLPGVIAIPSSLVITAITRASPMVVTITVNPATESNSYQVGQLVKLFIPYTYGMFQADGLVGKILVASASQLTLNIDSRNFDPFVVPAGSAEQPASLSPAGSQNYQYSNASRLIPFQSLNNRGN